MNRETRASMALDGFRVITWRGREVAVGRTKDGFTVILWGRTAGGGDVIEALVASQDCYAWKAIDGEIRGAVAR